MDDNLSVLLEFHNSFDFPLGPQSPGSSYPAHRQSQSERVFEDPAHLFSASGIAHLEVPEFIADRSIPSSATSSLTTPTQPLFIFPPVHAYRTLDPIPSDETGWTPSIAHSSQIPFPNPNPYLAPPYESTWHPVPQAIAYDEYAYNNFDGVVVPTPPHPTFYASGEGMHHPLLNEQGSAWPGHIDVVQQASERKPEDDSSVLGIGHHPMTKGKAKAAAPTGPKRVERSRKRQAPYKADKANEGARKLKIMSQQAFLSETPGYENIGDDDNASKTTTKRNKKKSHRLPTGPQVAGSSVGVDHHTSTPANTTPAGPIAAPPDPKRARLTAIRRHARLKEPGFTFVEGR